jgi:hypothetical protein
MRRYEKLILTTAALLVSSMTSLCPAAEDDQSARVEVTAIVPSNLPSFKDATIRCTLYEYDPVIADVSADVFERKEVDVSHASGADTEKHIVLGAGKMQRADRKYYVYVEIMSEGKQKHYCKPNHGGIGDVFPPDKGTWTAQ